MHSCHASEHTVFVSVFVEWLEGVGPANREPSVARLQPTVREKSKATISPSKARKPEETRLDL